MTNNFIVGSQWLTKGGWRAVIVKIDNDGYLTVWHSFDEECSTHLKDGTLHGFTDDYNLDKPYIEPRKGTVWVNVWEDNDDKRLFALAHIDKDEYEQDVSENRAHKLISSVKYDWIENEKL